MRLTRGSSSCRIQGRIDGLLVSAEEVLLEEIKTVQGGWDRAADPLHWAQAKIYGFIYAQANALERVTIQLSYLDLDTGEVTEFRERSLSGGAVGVLPGGNRDLPGLAAGATRLVPAAGRVHPRARIPVRQLPARPAGTGGGRLPRARQGRAAFPRSPHRHRQDHLRAVPGGQGAGRRQAGANLLPDRAHRRAGRGAKGPRGPAPGGAPLAHADADRQGEDLRSGRPALRRGDLPFCARLLRPLQSGDARGPGARRDHPAGARSRRSRAPGLPLRAIAGPVVLGGRRRV